MSLPKLVFEDIVRNALLEDIGTGDITTLATAGLDVKIRAVLLAKSPLVVCGLDVACLAFALVDDQIRFSPLVDEGIALDGQNKEIGIVDGKAASILTAERVALNFLQRLSGVATLTSAFVNAIAGTGATIVDTRKTTPGLRVLEKYAVRIGGASNHRFGLSDGVLIKDNHIAAAGGIAHAVRSARRTAPHTLRIELEVKNLQQVEEALEAGVDIILLDNMSLEDLRSAVAIVGNRALTEASGGVNLATVRDIAETGVNLISVGAMTHSAPAVDISLDFTHDRPPPDWRIRIKTETTSTNDDARLAVAENVREGMVFMAAYQTAGRGRRGAQWNADRGKSVLMTMVLYPKIDISIAWRLSWAACVAMIDALHSFGIEAKCKWPNDILVGEKKIAGILIETVPSPSHAYAALVGIGLNVMQREFENGDDYRIAPTSMSIVLGRLDLMSLRVARRVCYAVDRYCSTASDNWDRTLSAYKELLITGQVQSGIDPDAGEVVSGVLIGVRDSDGAALVKTGSDELRYILPEIAGGA
jgi:nicotinate-nucleotide pyrophosphorylase (carboxylating)